MHQIVLGLIHLEVRALACVESQVIALWHQAVILHPWLSDMQ